MNIKEITIVWWWTSWVLSVYYIIKKFPHIKVNWIFPENNLPIWVWEATIPQVCAFLIDLWLTPEIIINDLWWSVKLWIKFENFSSYWDFTHPFWKEKKDYIKHEFFINNNLIDNKVLWSLMNYAFHFDVKKMIDYLYEKIKCFSNVSIYRKEVSNIKTLNWKIIEVDWIWWDFFIDSTWFKKILISKICSNNFQEFQIINNQAFVYRDEYFDKKLQFKNHTTVSWQKYWWIWKIPLKDKLSLWYIHNSNNWDNVKKDFINYIKKEFWYYDESKINKVPFITWRNKKHIYNNVFAIWLSSAFIEPMESTWLYFITENIKNLWKYLTWKIDQNIINNNINSDYDSVMNFILAHYKFSNNNNEYWNYYKNLDVNLFIKSWLFWDYNWFLVMKWLLNKELYYYYNSDYIKNNFTSYYIYNKFYKDSFIKNWLDYNYFIDNKLYY